MEHFTIKKNGFDEIKRKVFIKNIGLGVLSLSAGLAISYFQQKEIKVLFFMLPLLIGILVFTIRQRLKKQKEIFEMYNLTIDDNCITKEQYSMPAIIISIADIDEIRKDPAGSFTIKGKSTKNTINIPAQITGYEKLEQRLSEIKPISITENNSKTVFQSWIKALLPIFTVGLMAAIYIAENKIAVGVCSTILVAITGYSFFTIQTNKNIDKKTKKRSWWILLVMVSIIVNLFYKIVES